MNSNKQFKKLLEPSFIGQVKTRNRIVKTGAGTFLWHQDDIHMDERILAYYEAIAKGGVGLLIVESPGIDYPLGVRWKERYRLDDDRYISGLSELVKVIHKHNCPTFMQMYHDGPWQAKLTISSDPVFSGPPVASSPVNIKSRNDLHDDMPRELTITEIEEIINKFASAAVRAQKAGFDGVEINAASSHLGHNFLSPFWNRRQDTYGGNVENRARFVTQIILEIKRRLGQDYPISVCINGIEMGQIIGVDNSKCLTADDGKQIARLLQKAGADMIHVRSHWLGYHVSSYLTEAFFYPEPPVSLKSFPKEYNWRQRGVGANINLAAGIKQVVTIPVMTVGRLDPVIGEKVVREGKADFIGMTRRLIADPELPNKVAEGRLEDIAPCTACSNCLGTGHCRINSLVGTNLVTIEKADKKKKVIVIGGGPAGMEASRVAALRGHDVQLYEKANKLGGLLSVAAMIKGTEQEDLPSIVFYFKNQLRKLGVAIRLGKEADSALIESIKPDVVIVATGGLPTIAEIPGINRHNVIGGDELHKKLKSLLRLFGPKTLRWLTNFYMPVGKKVVVIGGGIQGCQLAEFLVKRGRKVSVVDTAETMGEGMSEPFIEQLFMWFQKKNVNMIFGVKKCVEITDEGLIIIGKEGKKQTIEANSIVTALPLQPNKALYDALKEKVPEIYNVGDCSEPSLIVDAIGNSAQVARSI